MVAVAIAERVAKRVPRSHDHLSDQMRRAASSVPLNLTEGAAEFKVAEKARFYRQARRSAGECMAVLDVLVESSIKDAEDTEARAILREVAALITRLIKGLGRWKPMDGR